MPLPTLLLRQCFRTQTQDSAGACDEFEFVFETPHGAANVAPLGSRPAPYLLRRRATQEPNPLTFSSVRRAS